MGLVAYVVDLWYLRAIPNETKFVIVCYTLWDFNECTVLPKTKFSGSDKAEWETEGESECDAATVDVDDDDVYDVDDVTAGEKNWI